MISKGLHHTRFKLSMDLSEYRCIRARTCYILQGRPIFTQIQLSCRSAAFVYHGSSAPIVVAGYQRVPIRYRINHSELDPSHRWPKNGMPIRTACLARIQPTRARVVPIGVGKRALSRVAGVLRLQVVKYPTFLPLTWYTDLFLITRVAAAFTGIAGFYLGSQAHPDGPSVSTASLSTAPLANCEPAKFDLSIDNMRDAAAEFEKIIGKSNVLTDEDAMEAYAGSDWSSYSPKHGEKPSIVLSPSTTDHVSRIMKVCHRRRIPLTSYSGGTSLEGHFTPTRGGVCLNFQEMDQILSVHRDDLDVHVQAGVEWETLNEELAKDGLFFPPDPGPGALIGGMVGTGCSGTNAFHYGTMREWVVSLTVVLADGTVIKTRQRPRKSSAGYDLTKLFIGSEGTLGVVTEATLKLTVKPKNERVAVASFGSIHQAADCVATLVKEGVGLTAVELLDDVQMKCVNDSGSTNRVWKSAPTLFFKFAGSPAAVDEQIQITKRLAQEARSQSFEFAQSSEEAAELWEARKYALWSIAAMKKDPSDHVWTTDVAVPISQLANIIQQTKDEIDQSGLLGGIVGHVGDGNFHGQS